MESRQVLIATLLVFSLWSVVIHAEVNIANKVDLSKYNLIQVPTSVFRSPFYLVRGAIPFWSFGGDAVVTDDFVRLTPAEKSRSGWIWSTLKWAHPSFVVEATIRVGGGSSSIGADGLAFWYVQNPRPNGPIFGSADEWKGLAVILDTFDNDRQGNNPYISVYNNDGSWKYDPNQDGSDRELGGCKINYRNWDTKIRISYVEGILMVEVHVPSIATDYTLCAAVPMYLPQGYFFGISAATGGLTDNHDVKSFVAYRIEPNLDGSPNPYTLPDVQIPQQQQQQQQQFQEQQQQQQQEEPVVQRTLVEQGETQQQHNSESGGIQNRAQTITDQLKKIVHEFQDTNADPVVQTPTPSNPTPTTPSATISQSAGGNQDLLLEVGLLKNQQSALMASIASLQSQINSFGSNAQKTSSELQQILSSQQVLAGALDKLLGSAPSKQDLQALGNGNQGASQQQVAELIKYVMDLKTFVNDKLSMNADSFNRQVDGITRSMNELRSKIEASKTQQSMIEAAIRSNTQDLNNTIAQSTSFGFWTYFLLFQVIFGVAFMWWKKYRDDNSKKLL